MFRKLLPICFSLVCAVSYTTEGGEKMAFRKFFKFQVGIHVPVNFSDQCLSLCHVNKEEEENILTHKQMPCKANCNDTVCLLLQYIYIVYQRYR